MLQNPPSFILMLGAPGAGKGTYSHLLSKDFRLNELSSGDELRNMIKLNLPSPIPISDIKSTLQNGKLVSDTLALSIIFAKLSTKKYRNGAILDGFPRTITQAKYFESIHKINLIIKVDMDEEIIVRKMLGRRLCAFCGKGYNDCAIIEGDYYLPKILPVKKKGFCDKCGKSLKLIKRDDDNEDTIRNRIRLYKRMTKQVEEYYKERTYVFNPRKGLKDYYKLKNYVSNNLV